MYCIFRRIERLMIELGLGVMGLGSGSGIRVSFRVAGRDFKVRCGFG